MVGVPFPEKGSRIPQDYPTFLPWRTTTASRAEARLQGSQAQGFGTQLWILAQTAQVIQKVTGVCYNPGHVWYLLQKLDWPC
jgi:hypothetical protein